MKYHLSDMEWKGQFYIYLKNTYTHSLSLSLSSAHHTPLQKQEASSCRSSDIHNTWKYLKHKNCTYVAKIKFLSSNILIWAQANQTMNTNDFLYYLTHFKRINGCKSPENVEVISRNEQCISSKKTKTKTKTRSLQQICFILALQYLRIIIYYIQTAN